MLAFFKRPGVVKAIAVLVCTVLYLWKGVELDPDQLVEIFVSGLAMSQLVRRVGDSAPPQGPPAAPTRPAKAPPRNVWGP